MSTSETLSPAEMKNSGSADAARSAKNPVRWWQTQRTRQVSAAVGVIAVLGLLMWWFVFHPYVSTDDARIAMTFVRVAPANVGGRIEAVNIEEGTQVKPGDVLLEIDHRIPQANFDRAKARADLTMRELLRIQRLASEGSSTMQALDQAKAAATQAEAELKLAEVALENTYLKSPLAGIVVQKNADVGSLLEPGQVAVVIADEKHAWIAANIEETSVGSVKLGQPVHVSIDEGGVLEGKVIEVRSSVASQFALIPSDSGAGNYTKVVQRVPIKVAIEKNIENSSLRAGQSVEIKIRVH